MSLPARVWPLVSLLFTIVVFTTPHTLHAQQLDSTAFRRGQWGTEFAIGGSYQSFGVLRFATPTRAWIGALSATIYDSRAAEDDTPDPGNPASGATSSGLRRGELRVGHRWYRTLTDQLAQHVTVGAVASGDRRTTERAALPDRVESEAAAGIFADLGALWFVTRRLSLGAAWTTQATFTRWEARGGSLFDDGRSSTSSARLNFGQIRVHGALYF